jgi:hypothetical protein
MSSVVEELQENFAKRSSEHPNYLLCALLAQKESIKNWLLITYTNRQAIGEWNDYYYSISSFNAGIAAFKFKCSASNSRKILDSLSNLSILNRTKTHSSRGNKASPVTYRFDRKICDALAEEVTKELLAAGFVMDKTP